MLWLWLLLLLLLLLLLCACFGAASPWPSRPGAAALGAVHLLPPTLTPSQGVHVIRFPSRGTLKVKEALHTIHKWIILPSYLSHEQRKKVFSAKYRDQLHHDPISIEVNGQVKKFRYMNAITQMPNTRLLINEVINNLKVDKDYNAIPDMLEGVHHQAGRRIDPAIYCKLVRKFAVADRLQTIIDSVRAVRKTGFKLNRSETVNELMVGIQKKAIDSGYARHETLQAHMRVRAVLEMLEEDNELHKPEEPNWRPFWQDPMVLAARLHLGAVAATKHGQLMKSVPIYARDLLGVWPENKGVLGLHDMSKYASVDQARYLLDRNSFLWFAAPILKGLRMAADFLVDQPFLREALLNRAQKVQEEIDLAWNSRQRKPGGRGEALYRALFNPAEPQHPPEQEQDQWPAEEKGNGQPTPRKVRGLPPWKRDWWKRKKKKQKK